MVYQTHTHTHTPLQSSTHIICCGLLENKLYIISMNHGWVTARSDKLSSSLAPPRPLAHPFFFRGRNVLLRTRYLVGSLAVTVAATRLWRRDETDQWVSESLSHHSAQRIPGAGVQSSFHLPIRPQCHRASNGHGQLFPAGRWNLFPWRCNLFKGGPPTAHVIDFN